MRMFLTTLTAALLVFSGAAFAADLVRVEPLSKAKASSLIDAPYKLDARMCPITPVVGSNGDTLHYNNAAPELATVAWFGDQNNESRTETEEVEFASGATGKYEHPPVMTVEVVVETTGPLPRASAIEVGGLIFTYDAQMKRCQPNELVKYVRIN